MYLKWVNSGQGRLGGGVLSQSVVSAVVPVKTLSFASHTRSTEENEDNSFLAAADAIDSVFPASHVHSVHTLHIAQFLFVSFQSANVDNELYKQTRVVV